MRVYSVILAIVFALGVSLTGAAVSTSKAGSSNSFVVKRVRAPSHEAVRKKLNDRSAIRNQAPEAHRHSHISPLPADSSALVTTTASDTQQLLSAHNEARATLGSSPLTWDDSIASFASSYGQRCLFQHSHNPSYAENLAAETPYAATTTMKLFQYLWQEGEQCGYKREGCSEDSAGHYLNIIDPRLTKIGCAVVKCPGSLLGVESGDARFLVCDYAE